MAHISVTPESGGYCACRNKGAREGWGLEPEHSRPRWRWQNLKRAVIWDDTSCLAHETVLHDRSITRYAGCNPRLHAPLLSPTALTTFTLWQASPVIVVLWERWGKRGLVSFVSQLKTRHAFLAILSPWLPCIREATHTLTREIMAYLCGCCLLRSLYTCAA